MSLSTSETAKPTHPWAELSTREDKIIRGAPPKPETEYLATPEVKMVGKKEVIVDADGGRASYAFKLNTAPDSIWRGLFDTNLADPPEGINRADLRVEFRDDTLFLLCMPSRLEAKYAFVKTTVAKTNHDYQQEKETVRRRVSELDAEKKRAKTATKTKVEMVKERFNQLEL